jgi:hypothetical protein
MGTNPCPQLCAVCQNLPSCAAVNGQVNCPKLREKTSGTHMTLSCVGAGRWAAIAATPAGKCAAEMRTDRPDNKRETGEWAAIAAAPAGKRLSVHEWRARAQLRE